MSDEPSHMSKILARGQLSQLAREADRRRKETVEVKRRLPVAEAAHVVSASTNADGELVLVMDSPVWAARVRYSIPTLKNTNVRVRVLPQGGWRDPRG